MACPLLKDHGVGPPGLHAEALNVEGCLKSRMVPKDLYFHMPLPMSASLTWDSSLRSASEGSLGTCSRMSRFLDFWGQVGSQHSKCHPQDPLR